MLEGNTVANQENPNWIRSAGLRLLIVVVLIGVLTPLWIYLLFFTDLHMAIMATIALVILLLFSTATAWSAIAIPHRDKDDLKQDDQDNDERPTDPER